MKRYFRKNSFAFALMVTLAMASVAAGAQNRDPFSPTGGSILNSVKEAVGVKPENPENNFKLGSDPLTSGQLSAYKVVGVIISETQKIASIKAMNGISYPVKIGDALGIEGGKISDITINGLVVQTEKEELKLPVSNKIEVPVDQGKTNSSN